MVRRCAVRTCESTDKTTMSHRFPRKVDSALKWQESLQLRNTQLDELIQRYVVCTLHFKASDYRNAASKHLNFTAVPTLYVSQSQTDTTEEPITLPSGRNAPSPCTTINDAEQLMNLELYRTELGQCTNSEDADRPSETFDKSMSTYFCEDTDQHMIDPNQFGVEPDLNPSPSYSNDFIEIEEAEEEEEEGSVTFCNYDPPEEEDVIQEERPEDSESECVYVDEEELFETVDEEVSFTENAEKIDKQEVEDSEEPLMYRQMSRLTLVQNLIEANKKIAELECKLKSFESAHSTLLSNFETFKSLLKP